MSIPGAVAGVPWQELEHAFGPADDIPELLAGLSRSRGRKLRNEMSQLCERVLHQGTIYSASPPALRELIPMADGVKGQDRAVFYEVFAEFASSSRKALRDGRAIPCCSGGDPEHGRAILSSLLDARQQFAADLTGTDPILRRLAGSLLCCSAEASSDSALLVRHQYDVETDAAVRVNLLRSLSRVRERFTDWPGLLAGALGRESETSVRFVLRCMQIREMREEADTTAANELVTAFIATTESEFGGEPGRFFEAVQWLGPVRGFSALLQALDGCKDRDTILLIAERILRLAFQDQRSGWEDRSYSIVREGAPPQNATDFPKSMMKAIFKMVALVILWKIFPFLLRRKMRTNRNERDQRRHKIEYWGVKESAPGLPDQFTADQCRALTALAEKSEVWIDQTNLWPLFGLPGSAAELRTVLARG